MGLCDSGWGSAISRGEKRGGIKIVNLINRFFDSIEAKCNCFQSSIVQMYRNLGSQLSPFEQAEDNHKDIVIATLKKELNDLRDLESDFLRLNDEIARLESKYALLLEEKDRNQKEHRLKMDINKKAIADMRADVDSLKIQIHKTTTQIQETIRENSTLKRMCDNRNSEISSLMANNRELEKRNETQAEDNRNITFNIKQLKEEKIKLEAECERLHSLLDSNVQNLKNAEKEARVLENTNNKLDNTLAQAEKDNQKLLEEMKLRETSLQKTQKNLDDLGAKTESMKGKNKQLEGECTRLEVECQSANATLNVEVNKNKQLASKLKSIDNTIRATEAELQESMNKKEGLKKEHFQLVGDNRTLNSEIDNCLLTILDYEKLNNDLQKEIQNYIQTDQQARSLLNRKDVMKSLLDQVNTRLEKTSDQIAHLR